MTPRQMALVLAVTAGLTAVVLLAVDWSPRALQDPARTLGLLNAQGVVHLGGIADRAPFSLLEFGMFLAVGLGLVLSGVAAWRSQPSGRPGFLLVLAGWLWLAAGLRRSSDPFAFTAGVTLTLMYQPPLLQLALSFPTGKLKTRLQQGAVVFFFSLWLAIAVANWAFFDPRLHVAAGESTARNLLLLWDDLALTTAIGNAARVVQICVGLAIVLLLAVRWHAGTPAYRSAFLPLGLALALKTAATVWAAAAVVQFSGPQASEALLWQYPATAVIPLAVLLGLWRYRFARGSLSELMVEIGAAPLSDRLTEALRKTVRDPSLELWQWSPVRPGFVDGHGKARELPEEHSGRAAMVLERKGTPVGALVFDQALREQPALLEAVRSATSLTLENRNMEEQLREQLLEVRRSRERIVTAGDARRRQLERDLHDGAQQRLVAVAMELARARRLVADADARELIGHAAAELNLALGELRELARGVYPPSLRERGLAGALTALAERTAVPMEVRVELAAPVPPAVELAAYFICAEAVTNTAKHAEATMIRASATGAADRLTVVIGDNGRGGAAPGPDGGLMGLADRAAALGGTFDVVSPPGQGTTVTAVLPFALDPATAPGALPGEGKGGLP
ncbi:histidine kinase [Arthrobacter cupressi]